MYKPLPLLFSVNEITVCVKNGTCNSLFNDGFSQAMCKASLIFNWKDVEAVSRIEKQFSEHKALHVSDP